MTPGNRTGDVCIPNIGARERRKRMGFGIAMFVVGAGLAALVVGFDVPRPWRLAVLPAFWLGALGVLQAREKT